MEKPISMAFRFLYKLLSFDEFFRAIIIAFPTGRDSETFRDNGTKIPSLSRDKGTAGQAKRAARGRYGSGQPEAVTGRAGTAKKQDGTRDKMGQSRKDVLKQENNVVKQKMLF